MQAGHHNSDRGAAGGTCYGRHGCGHRTWAAGAVVSVNAPGITETNNMIRGKHFRLLPDGAVFINTARSSIVNQNEMIEELRRERFVACIDVTDPEEPPPKGYPLRKLPNVLLTPHFAGAIAQGESRIGRLVAGEIEAFVTGRTLSYQVTEQDLQRMA